MRIWMGPKYNDTNMYNQLLSESLEGIGLEVNDVKRKQFSKLQRGDVLHVHWIHPLYQNNNLLLFLVRSLIMVLVFSFLRMKGVVLIWTIHNLYPHQHKFPRLEKLVRKTFIMLCSKCVTASHFIKKQVVEVFGANPDKIAVIPHGHYQGVYQHQGKNYREVYGIPEDGYVYLFIGAIKPYKGVQQLVESFNRIKSENTYLVIAGKPTKDMEEYLSRYQGQHQIILDLRFVPDEEVADIISMCDSFVLPFQEITTSGSAILALSFKKPIVIPKTPFVDEYFTPEIASIYDPQKGELLETAMEQVRRVEADKVEPVYEQILARLDWKNIALQLSEIYQNRPAAQVSRAFDKS
ncbi:MULTISPECIES: glycosyltransferase [Paenibacillus]|uniref:glycosyltransferase n=1 Tax=Paenibacillus TaxID=44249 RepID=UPI0022B86DD8|nr:glycosyltransferase [Paenibacillus caseinilyticus]MCZ8519316.1 glycosyltransferase [Paenibacillus caseinilyticus]